MLRRKETDICFMWYVLEVLLVVLVVSKIPIASIQTLVKRIVVLLFALKAEIPIC